jgi:hypothetical protein
MANVKYQVLQGTAAEIDSVKRAKLLSYATDIPALRYYYDATNFRDALMILSGAVQQTVSSMILADDGYIGSASGGRFYFRDDTRDYFEAYNADMLVKGANGWASLNDTAFAYIGDTTAYIKATRGATYPSELRIGFTGNDIILTGTLATISDMNMLINGSQSFAEPGDTTYLYMGDTSNYLKIVKTAYTSDNLYLCMTSTDGSPNTGGLSLVTGAGYYLTSRLGSQEADGAYLLIETAYTGYEGANTNYFKFVNGYGTITDSSTNNILTLENTNEGATGVVLELYHNSASPAANYVIGTIDYYGRDSAANKQLYWSTRTVIVSPTSGSESSYLTEYGINASLIGDPSHVRTGEGGIGMTMTAGENLTRGEIVYFNQAGTSMRVYKAPTSNDMPVGIVYQSATTGNAVIIVYAGCAYVLFQNSHAPTLGYICLTSATTAGRAYNASSAASVAEHFREIGHTMETVSSGTNVLARVWLHFN